MAELEPQSLRVLALRALREREGHDRIFDLPARSFWTPPRDVDLSVTFHGERAGNPSGPAAGPHSQMAQNIALAWLAGARVIELKTVQIKDDLEIGRPCIDVQTIGFNIEWSQELRVEQSLREYVKAWMLLRILCEGGVAPVQTVEGTLFDLSVGYDLAGIQGDRVTSFIRGMMDATPTIDRLREELTGDLAAYRDLDFDPKIGDCITLSTFHGCPSDEIEKIANYLLDDVGTHVIVKLNPTLLGYDEVRGLLNDTLGYEDIRLDKKAFDEDLPWDAALEMIGRLRERGAARGLHVGVKLTNTLVVQNHKNWMPEKIMYLSGQPLHVLATTLAARLRRAVGAELPMSFSAGIDQKNFADAVACRFLPVTACSDLLRPGGYGRLSRYLSTLADRMRKAGVTDIAGWQANQQPDAVAGLEAYAEAVAADPRYSAPANRKVPRKIGSSLELFDCINCNKCIPVCPNDANFSWATEADERPGVRLTVEAGTIRRQVDVPFTVEKSHQLATYAGFCNRCGNCDVFCPEDGGPYAVKPLFFADVEAMRAAGGDGCVVEAIPGDADGGRRLRMTAIFAGREVTLEQQGTGFIGRGDGIEVELDRDGDVQRADLLGDARDGSQLRVGVLHTMRHLLLGVTQSGAVNAVTALLDGA